MITAKSPEPKPKAHVDDGYDEPIDDSEIVEDPDFDLGIPELRHGYVSPEERKRKACWPDGPVRTWQKYLLLFILMAVLGMGLGMPHEPNWWLDGWKWVDWWPKPVEVAEPAPSDSDGGGAKQVVDHESLDRFAASAPVQQAVPTPVPSGPVMK